MKIVFFNFVFMSFSKSEIGLVLVFGLLDHYFWSYLKKLYIAGKSNVISFK